MEDDIRRCYYCASVWMKKEVAGEGCCLRCGSRKFTDVRRMTDEEMEKLVARGFQPTADWEHHDSPVG